SPPGSAADGVIASMCGRPLTFFLPSSRSEIPMSFRRDSGKDAAAQQELHREPGICARAEVIHHNAGARRQSLQTPHGPRLHNVEATKKYKSRQQRFPIERRCSECKPLARD